MKIFKRSLRLFLFFILFSTSFACNTERRDNQGEYSEGDNELIEEDSVNTDEKNH